ncbi:unnamed protein product [Cutaneotrichosporon oleaginosum]
MSDVTPILYPPSLNPFHDDPHLFFVAASYCWHEELPHLDSLRRAHLPQSPAKRSFFATLAPKLSGPDAESPVVNGQANPPLARNPYTPGRQLTNAELPRQAMKFATPEEEIAYFTQFVHDWQAPSYPSVEGQRSMRIASNPLLNGGLKPPKVMGNQPHAIVPTTPQAAASCTQTPAHNSVPSLATGLASSPMPSRPIGRLALSSAFAVPQQNPPTGQPTHTPALNIRPKPQLPNIKLAVIALQLLDEGKRHPAMDHSGLNSMLEHLAQVLDTSRALPRLFAHQFHMSKAVEPALRVRPALLIPTYLKYREETIKAFRAATNQDPHPITVPLPYTWPIQCSPPLAGSLRSRDA